MARYESLPIGRFAGVPVRLHTAWLAVVPLLAVWLATAHLPGAMPVTGPILWMTAALTALGYLASVMAHEALHLYVARRRGIPIEHTLLFFFGGMVRSYRRPLAPADELSYALAGPAANLLIGLALGGAASLTGGWAAPLLWLAGANLALALANLLPVHPLDGGRIAQAAIWRRTGDLAGALRLTRTGGGILAIALGVEGVLLLLWQGETTAAILVFLAALLVLRATDTLPAGSRILLLRRSVTLDAVLEPAAPRTVPDGPRLTSAATLHDALVLMDEAGQDRIIVSDDSRPVGLVTRGAILAYLAHHAPAPPKPARVPLWR